MCGTHLRTNARLTFSDAVIFMSDFSKFRSPEDYYYLKKVKVRGMLKEYKGKPEIIVKTPSQIEILK